MNRNLHRRASWSLALAAAAALTGTTAHAAGDEAATLKALQQQLQQIQAELRSLAEENRALR